MLTLSPLAREVLLVIGLVCLLLEALAFNLNKPGQPPRIVLGWLGLFLIFLGGV